MTKIILSACVMLIAPRLYALEFTSVSLQGRLNSTDTITNVGVYLDGTNLGAALTLVPDSKGVFTTKFSVLPDILSQCSSCVLSLKKADGTVLSTSPLRSVPFALAVSGDGIDANLLRSSGNVGIGTTNPSYKLDVNGDVHSGGNYFGDGSNLLGVLHSETDPLSVKKTGDTMSGTLNMGSQQITGTGAITMGTAAFTGSSFSVGGTTMAVKNGKVGIGTATPLTSLDVVGNIRIADGTQRGGRVLTSNANGIATWQVPASTFSIGDDYGGGRIFWIDTFGKQVLIVAAVDQSIGARWSNNTNRTGAILDGIYSGKANTVMISTMQEVGNYAAHVCSDYSVTVNNEYYDDWYLPSQAELGELYANRGAVGLAGANGYWSSTEVMPNTSNAGYVDFSNGSIGSASKMAMLHVRCVRAGPSTPVGNLPVNAETVTNGAYVNSTQTFTGANIFKDITATSIAVDSVTITGNAGGYGLTVSSNVAIASMLYSANGNIGIGLPDPMHKLDVIGDINITGAYRVNGLVPPGLGDVVLSATQTFTGANTFAQKLTVAGLIESTFGGIKFPDGSVQSAAPVTLWIASGTSIFNANPGSIGIGTTDPLGPLDVHVTTFKYSNKYVPNYSHSSPRCPCDVREMAADCGAEFTSLDVGPVCYDWSSFSNSYGTFFSQAQYDKTFVNTPTLIVSKNANVGIGNNSPDQKLAVSGNISQTGIILSSGTGDNFFAGRVGIGTSSPQSALDVNGGITADYFGRVEYSGSVQYGQGISQTICVPIYRTGLINVTMGDAAKLYYYGVSPVAVFQLAGADKNEYAISVTTGSQCNLSDSSGSGWSIVVTVSYALGGFGYPSKPYRITRMQF